MNVVLDVGTLAALVAIVGGPWAVTWREIVKLRSGRHDTSTALAGLKVNMENVQADVTQVKDDVRQVRDALLGAGVIKAKGGI